VTGKERVLASFRGEETDHLCWAPLIDGYFTSSLPAQGYPEHNVPDALRLVGADIIERHSPTIRRVEDGTIQRRTEYRDGVELEIVETPVGALTTERRKTDTGQTTFITKRPIVTVEDVRVYQYITEHTRFAADFAAFRERMALIGDDGIPTSSGPLTPIQAFLQHLCGVADTIYLLMDYPREMAECFAVMHEQNKEAYRLIGESPTEAVFIYEDTSSTVISPEYYAQYCAAYIDEYAQICHDAGKWFMTHMCGKLSAFNSRLKAGQQDGIDSVCPPTTGDIWAHQARAAWGPGKVIIGGLEPPALKRMTVAETRDYVTRVLDQMPTFRRFILSTGDATSHGTPVENLRAISEVVAAWGWK